VRRTISIVAASLLALSLGGRLDAQSSGAVPLALGGYALGQVRAQAVAPAVPCSAPLPDVPEYTSCKPSATLSLGFQRDTLVTISMVLLKESGPQWADSTPARVWMRVKDQVAEWFGTPEAVTHERQSVTAVWNGKGARFAIVQVLIERAVRGLPPRVSVTATLRCSEGESGPDIGRCLQAPAAPGRRRA
jgi:hypothetical protein